MHQPVNHGENNKSIKLCKCMGGMKPADWVYAIVIKLFHLNVFLRIVPGTSSVGCRDGNLNTRDKSTSENPREGLNTKQDTNNKRGEHDKCTRGDHLLDGCISGDLDTRRIVRLGGALHDPRYGIELPADFLNHLECCATYTLHGHC
uniref:Vpp1 n=1 Tax=Arundo donax TaxID=35708 RepID=A0A0A9CXE4_ARUDO